MFKVLITYYNFGDTDARRGDKFDNYQLLSKIFSKTNILRISEIISYCASGGSKSVN